MDKLNVTFCSSPDFSSNAKSLYEYMKERYKDGMNFIWACQTDDMTDILNSEGITAYKIGTEEYYEAMKKTNIFFSTHCNIIGEKNKDSLYIELWHGISPKQLGYLSDNMSKADEGWYGYVKDRIDYIILPSEFWRVIFSTRFNIEYSKTLSLGYPKLDYFLNKNAKRNLEKILNEDISSYNKVIYYMPTFRKGYGRNLESKINLQNLLNIESYEEDKLNSFLVENNYLLCVKKHPGEELELKDYTSKNVRIIKEQSLADNNISVNEILDAADLMITDYSSLGIEFLFLDKPVVYLVNDIEEYGKNRGFTFNDISFWMTGYKVKNIDELKEAIEGSFCEKYKYKDELKHKKKLWFSDLKNGGCENICNYLFENNNIKESILQDIDNRNKKSKVKILENRIEELNNIVSQQSEALNQKDSIIEQKDNLIEEILNSKGWQFLESVREIKKKFTGK